MSMQVIEHIEVGSGGLAEVEFTSIPATYTDLLIVYSFRSETAQRDFGVKFNGSSANFSNRILQGTGSSVNSGTGYGNYIGTLSGSADTANTFGSGRLYIPNYAGSTNKSYSVDAVQETNAATSYQAIVAGLWSVTDAITSVALYQLQGNDTAQYSSATLYGITAGSDGTTTVS